MGDLIRVESSLPVQLVDANDLQVADITSLTPVGTESGLIVRNIPNGTQVVAGTITASPTGTYTVAGSVTAIPSGTQTVNGTVTAVQSGTYTVSGTVTAVPSGTQTVAGTISADLTSASYKSKGTNSFTPVAPTGSATQIVASNANRSSLLIYNNGSVVVFLGRSNTVSTSNGMPLNPMSSLEDSESTDAWYAITAGGTGDLRVIETTI